MDVQDTRITISRRAWMVYVTMCLIFGTTFLAIKIGSDAGVPPFLAGGLRFTTAGLILVAARGGLFRRGGGPNFEYVWRVMVLGILIIGITFAATYWAAQHIASGHVAQIQAASPIVVAALSVALLGKRLNVVHVVGLAVGLGGSVFLIGAARGAGDMALAGAVAAFVAELAYGLGTVWYRRAFRTAPDSVRTNGYNMLFGGLFLLGIAVATGQTSMPVSRAALGSLIYLVVFGSIGAHSMYLWLIGNVSPLFASTWLFVSPIIATVIGAIVLGEHVGVGNIAGAAAVLVGVYLVQRAERRGSE